MLPYIHVSDVPGPIPLHPFGILVATGVILGTNITLWRARKRGIHVDLLNSFITWMLIAGFVGGHVLDEIFYHPAEILKRPIGLVALWEGLSSFGGFTGGLIGVLLWKFFEPVAQEGRDRRALRGAGIGALSGLALGIAIGFFVWNGSYAHVPFAGDGIRVWLRAKGLAEPLSAAISFGAMTAVLGLGLGALRSTIQRRASAMPILPFCDVILSVFPVAWIFGRSGCTVVHDHPGMLTGPNSVLAVGYPPDGPLRGAHWFSLIHGPIHKYDLGLLELMFTVVLSFLLVLTWRKRLPTGTYVVAVSLAYAPVRFAMDFLRTKDGDNADPRYGSLTPAQWACVALGLAGVGVALLIRRNLKGGVDPMDRVLAASPLTLSTTSESGASA